MPGVQTTHTESSAGIAQGGQQAAVCIWASSPLNAGKHNHPTRGRDRLALPAAGQGRSRKRYLMCPIPSLRAACYSLQPTTSSATSSTLFTHKTLRKQEQILIIVFIESHGGESHHAAAIQSASVQAGRRACAAGCARSGRADPTTVARRLCWLMPPRGEISSTFLQTAALQAVLVRFRRWRRRTLLGRRRRMFGLR